MKNKMRIAALCALSLAAGMAIATPNMTIDSVLQRYPWENTVDIRYTVGGVGSGDRYNIAFSASIDGAAAAPAGSTNVTANGTYVYQWTPTAGTLTTNCVVTAEMAVAYDPFTVAICPARNLAFSSESENPWYIDESVESVAARSGAIPDNGITSLTTTLQGQGTLSFRWKVSSEKSWDKLYFSVDGWKSSCTNISGTVGWIYYTTNITVSGSHAVEWRYNKDSSRSSGSDCGWVDDVIWTPAE